MDTDNLQKIKSSKFRGVPVQVQAWLDEIKTHLSFHIFTNDKNSSAVPSFRYTLHFRDKRTNSSKSCSVRIIMNRLENNKAQIVRDHLLPRIDLFVNTEVGLQEMVLVTENLLLHELIHLYQFYSLGIRASSKAEEYYKFRKRIRKDDILNEGLGDFFKNIVNVFYLTDPIEKSAFIPQAASGENIEIQNMLDFLKNDPNQLLSLLSEQAGELGITAQQYYFHIRNALKFDFPHVFAFMSPFKASDSLEFCKKIHVHFKRSKFIHKMLKYKYLNSLSTNK